MTMTAAGEMGSAALRVHMMLEALGWPRERFFVGGSGVLALRGIRSIGTDLDLGVDTRFWHALLLGGEWEVVTPEPHDEKRRCDPAYLRRDVHGTEVNVFSAWRWRGPHETPFNDYNLVFREGIEWIHGWPCLKLVILLGQKVDAASHPQRRDKDVIDIELISRYMEADDQPPRRAHATRRDNIGKNWDGDRV